MDFVKNKQTNWAAKIMPQRVLRPSRKPPFQITPKFQQFNNNDNSNKTNNKIVEIPRSNRPINSNNSMDSFKDEKLIHTKFKNDVLYCNSWDGVGDILWIYNKLKSPNYKLHLDIFRTESRPIRGNQLLDNLPNVTYTYHTQKGNDRIVGKIHKQCYDPNIKQSQIFNELLKNGDGVYQSLCPNRHMESGLHLKYFWPGFDLKYDFVKWKPENINYNLIKDIDKNWVFIHPATYGSTLWSLHITQLLKIFEYFNKQNIKVGFTGGLYDKINWEQTKKIIESKYGYSPIMLVGQHLSTCIEGLKKSKCLIGFICGLTILANSENIPVVAIWPETLQKMLYTITNPDVNTPYKPFIKNDFENNYDIISSEMFDWIEKL